MSVLLIPNRPPFVMSETKQDSNSIKMQEWTVMFDGDIRHSEKHIESDDYHQEIKKSEKQSFI